MNKKKKDASTRMRKPTNSRAIRRHTNRTKRAYFAQNNSVGEKRVDFQTSDREKNATVHSSAAIRDSLLYLHEQSGGRLIEELLGLIFVSSSDDDVAPLIQECLDDTLSRFAGAAQHKHSIGTTLLDGRLGTVIVERKNQGKIFQPGRVGRVRVYNAGCAGAMYDFLRSPCGLKCFRTLGVNLKRNV